jgi:hypothetical protein
LFNPTCGNAVAMLKKTAAFISGHYWICLSSLISFLCCIYVANCSYKSKSIFEYLFFSHLKIKKIRIALKGVG